jgi:hypothetical protein
MIVKLFEVRDRGTFLPCIGIACGLLEVGLGFREFKLLERSGYGQRLILFGRLEGGEFSFDPYDHKGGARTVAEAHRYIAEHWDDLESGTLIDVEFVLGESEAPKESEL